MPTPLPFAEAGRLPLPEDNVAVAIRRLEAGTSVEKDGQVFSLSHTMLEGHRFAVSPIPKGDALLSWRRSFGKSLRDIQPGEYVCNQGMLDSLSLRHLDFPLPAQPNFEEDLHTLHFDEKACHVVDQVALSSDPRTFPGYHRPGGRGVGVRNYIVLLGVNARVAGFVRQLESRLKNEARGLSNVHGIVAVAHTEGDQPDPNNLEFILRTLGGYVVHPNTAAVLVIDAGDQDPVHAGTLLGWMKKAGYALGYVPHRTFHATGDFETNLAEAAEIARSWVPSVQDQVRRPAPLSALKVALQCGGSDAFSGISANPLLGWVSRELIRHGLYDRPGADSRGGTAFSRDCGQFSPARRLARRLGGGKSHRWQ
jgi:hypothetical protein